jgi:transcriptional regulator with XRE-family HTH domain
MKNATDFSGRVVAMADDQRKALGQRLKQTAKAAGFTSEQIGERLGYTGGGVRGWWMGKAEPPMDVLRRYSELVGRSVDYLVRGVGSDHDFDNVVCDAIAHWADLVASKVSGTEAMAVVLGDRFRDPPTRKRLDEVAPQMLEMLSEHAGKSWEEASEADRRRAVRLLMAELEGWRSRQKP